MALIPLHGGPIVNQKPPLVELKNGKLVFRQKPLSLEKLSETMQEIVLFREMLEQRSEQQGSPLDAIPDQYTPLIVKLVHESDKTLQALSKHVHQQLLPVQLDDDDEISSSATELLSLRVVEAAIRSVASRTNYGLDSHPSGAKIPGQMCIWRWEVAGGHQDLLPKSLKDKIEARLLERHQAKKDVAALFESLSLDERSSILGSKATSKDLSGALSHKQVDGGSIEPIASGSGSNDGSVISPAHKSTSKPKKATNLEKAAKDKEKQEKKIARAEREKKAKDAHNKSRDILVNFFSKPKPNEDPESSIVPITTQLTQTSLSKSDFQKTFRSFALKKGAELAPINWFRLSENGRRPAAKQKTIDLDGRRVIIVDDDDTFLPQDVEMENAIDLDQMTDKERLDQVLLLLSQFSCSNNRARPFRTSNLKTSSRYSVRGILNEVAEAEISGDASTVRSLHALLHNRSLIPAKVLIFAEDSRPGYHGTWTRNSMVVGPRTPLARDTVALDYSCDSGEEWEDEDPGEADDVVEDNDEDEQDDGKDSDADSWLVDDDDAEPELLVDDLTPLSGTDPLAPPKRKASTAEPPKPHKKRKVVPLVPFIKGPSWESSIGKSTDIFKPYQIRLFNDTLYPIDPFTFTPAPGEEKSSDPRFVVPALPDRILPLSNPNLPVPATTAIKKSVPTPKQLFPDAHLPALLARITSLATGSLALIVEAVYQELKDQKVKKNSIEAKIREVAAKQNKIWVVKADVEVN